MNLTKLIKIKNLLIKWLPFFFLVALSSKVFPAKIDDIKVLIHQKEKIILGCKHKKNDPRHKHEAWVTYDFFAASGDTTDIKADIKDIAKVSELYGIKEKLKILFSEDCCPINITFGKVGAQKTLKKEQKDFSLIFLKTSYEMLRNKGFLMVGPGGGCALQNEVVKGFNLLIKKTRLPFVKLNSFQKYYFFQTNKKSFPQFAAVGNSPKSKLLWDYYALYSKSHLELDDDGAFFQQKMYDDLIKGKRKIGTKTEKFLLYLLAFLKGQFNNKILKDKESQALYSALDYMFQIAVYQKIK